MEKKNKKSRLWVNVLGIPLLLACIYYGDSSIPLVKNVSLPLFSLFIYIVMFLSMIEWLDLIDIKSLRLRAINLLSIFFIYYYLFFHQWLGLLFVIMIHGLIISIFHILVVTEKPLLQISSSIFGVLWVGLFLGSMIIVRHFSLELTLMMFLSVWICDTFAFFFGSKFGKKKILPLVSPNKSWVGSISGMVGSIIFMCILHSCNIYEGWITIYQAIIFGFIFGGLSQFGDFSESVIKREFGLKDTSNILQGHGGILDRFDSLAIASPLALLYIVCIGKLII